MCSEFPTSRNPKATVTHGGCSPTEVKPSCRDAANPLFWGTQHLPKLQHSEEQLMQQALSPEHGTALWASQVPPPPTCRTKEPGGGRRARPDPPHTRLRGLRDPPRKPQPPGRTYKDDQVEEDHHDLDKGEAPHLCTWGEQRGYRGTLTQHSCRPESPGETRGSPRAGRDRARLTCTESSS